MAMTKRLGAYADIHAAFLAALEHSGGTLTFQTPGAARNWRQRAYYYRQLLGKAYPEFDRLHLRHTNYKVQITLIQLDAEFTTPEGEAVAIELETESPQQPAPNAGGDSLLADAQALVRTAEKT